MSKKTTLVPLKRTTKKRPSNQGDGFRKGDKVILKKAGSLSSYNIICIQYFPANTEGVVVGFSQDNVVVEIKGEQWEVAPTVLKKKER